MYVGEGVAPVPAKLATKIKRWEYVEMGELLPEFWLSASDNEVRKTALTRRPRKITDIATWTQCYGVLVSVLGPSNPLAFLPELMAYMSNIIRASQDIEGLAWERPAFRRQAAVTGNKNSSLYFNLLQLVHSEQTAEVRSVSGHHPHYHPVCTARKPGPRTGLPGKGGGVSPGSYGPKGGSAHNCGHP